MTIDIKKDEEHESYGAITIGKPTSNPPQPLFGSSINHSHYVNLTIHTATLRRDLSNNYHYPHKKLISVDLSLSQFATMITSAGNGGGTPCTLRQHNGKRLAKPPTPEMREQYNEELDGTFKRTEECLRTASSMVNVLLKKKGSPTKKDLQLIANQMHHAAMNFKDNAPFVRDQLMEQMDKTTHEAKGEIEAYFDTRRTQLGLDGLVEDHPLLGKPTEDK